MFVLVLLAIFTLLALIYFRKCSNNSPPGPWGLPIVGYYPFIGSKAIAKIQELSKKYGEVMKINFLAEDYYFFNSLRTVKEVYDSQDDNVLGRPLHKFNVITYLFGKEDVVNAEGESWKTQRQFILKKLSYLGMGKSEIEPKIHEVCDYMLDNIHQLNGKPKDLMAFFANYASNNISMLLYGNYFRLDDPTYIRLLELPREFCLHLGDLDGILVGKLFYLSVRMRPKLYQEMVKLKKEFFDLTSRLVKQRMNDVEANKNESKREDLLDGFIEQMKGPNSECFTLKSVVETITHLFTAGIESTTSWLYFAIFLMVKNPLIQKRVQQEIDEIVGNERRVSLSDRKFFNYVQAVIAEINRFATVGPVGLIRVNYHEFTIDGYTIPKRSNLIANLFRVSREEKCIKNPQNFDPNNFLVDNSNYIPNEASMQFSVGKRNCLGARLAEDELFIAFTTLLQKFNWVLPEDSDPILNVKEGLLRMLHPYEVCALQR